MKTLYFLSMYEPGFWFRLPWSTDLVEYRNLHNDHGWQVSKTHVPVLMA